MTARPPRLVVVGGGLAGLAAAWEATQRGVSVQVLEASSRLGGVVRTDVEGPFVLDTGPDAFLASKPGAMQLCRELAIDDQLIPMRPPRGAYILRGQRLHALPDGGAFGIATRVVPFLRSSLLSPLGKVRVACEPLVPRRRVTHDESAGAFFRRRFGREAAARIAQPLLGGIHAGDLDALSAETVLPQLVRVERQGRSVLLALRRQSRQPLEGGAFRSFPGGMATLVDALAARLPEGTIRRDCPVVAIQRAGQTWRLATPADVVEADAVVLAVPAPVVARLLADVAPEAARLAAEVPYVSSAGVLSVYRTSDIARPLVGSGYVSTPEPGRDALLATSWLSHKWVGRAPEGFTVLRGFFGGAFDQQVLAESDQSLQALAHASWVTRFGVSAEPVLSRVVRWTNASPQHIVGHAARVARLEALLEGLPPVAVCGSGFRAVGIPDVITDARATVRALDDRVRRAAGRMPDEWPSPLDSSLS